MATASFHLRCMLKLKIIATLTPSLQKSAKQRIASTRYHMKRLVKEASRLVPK
jgi:hypothetical protein